MNRRSALIVLTLLIAGCIVGAISGMAMVDSINNGQVPGETPLEGRMAQGIMISAAILCMSIAVIIALVISYVRIYVSTRSRYIGALLLFFVPALIKSVFSLRTVYALIRILANNSETITQDFGFTQSGFGGLFVIVTIFELIAASTLLYLSME